MAEPLANTAANIPSGHVRVILVGFRYFKQLDVPCTMTIKDLRKELYVSVISERSRVMFRDRSPEALRMGYCDYEFVLVHCKDGDRVGFASGEALDDASVCGDHVTPGKPALLRVLPKFNAYSGSIRTAVPGDYEREEKQAFMITVRNLPHMDFNLVVLAVGANTPEQVLPNFAIDAAKFGYRVCILAINPGFYHGIYPCLRDILYGTSGMSVATLHFLAYNRHPPSHQCTTVYDRARAWESWQRTKRSDFAGSFVLTPEAMDTLDSGYMEMHTFAMSWPGKPVNRDLDEDVLLAVSQTIPFLCTTMCHFVAFFSTWSDETDLHITHLSQWRANVPFFNSFHAILDKYETSSGRFQVFQNIDLAISCTSHLHDDEMLKALGGYRISTLAAVSLDNLGFFESNAKWYTNCTLL